MRKLAPGSQLFLPRVLGSLRPWSGKTLKAGHPVSKQVAAHRWPRTALCTLTSQVRV